jgi:hypothetical protein
VDWIRLLVTADVDTTWLLLEVADVDGASLVVEDDEQLAASITAHKDGTAASFEKLLCFISDSLGFRSIEAFCGRGRQLTDDASSRISVTDLGSVTMALCAVCNTR